MPHFGDKHLFCNGCKKDILIRFNQVGGFWHLTGWANNHGVKFYGGYCTTCFDKLKSIKDKPSSFLTGNECGDKLYVQEDTL